MRRNNHDADKKSSTKLKPLSVRRSRAWWNYLPRRRVRYWKQMRKAEYESESWRRTSKHCLRGLWTERQRWNGRTVCSIFHRCVGAEMLKSLCRMKERAKRAGAQRREEESERSALQVMMTSNWLRPTAPLLCCPPLIRVTSSCPSV